MYLNIDPHFQFLAEIDIKYNNQETVYLRQLKNIHEERNVKSLMRTVKCVKNLFSQKIPEMRTVDGQRPKASHHHHNHHAEGGGQAHRHREGHKGGEGGSAAHNKNKLESKIQIRWESIKTLKSCLQKSNETVNDQFIQAQLLQLLAHTIRSLNTDLTQGVYETHIDLLSLLKHNLQKRDGLQILKPNDFSQPNEYLINYCLSQQLSKMEDDRESDQYFAREEIVEFFLQALLQNDNSQNFQDPEHHHHQIYQQQQVKSGRGKRARRQREEGEEGNEEGGPEDEEEEAEDEEEAAASRANGKKGGRPRKVANG